MQIKGVVEEMHAPTSEQLARVEEHVAAFVDQAEQVGITRNQALRLVERELVAVMFAVRELYDQTPGPGGIWPRVASR